MSTSEEVRQWVNTLALPAAAVTSSCVMGSSFERGLKGFMSADASGRDHLKEAGSLMGEKFGEQLGSSLSKPTGPFFSFLSFGRR